MNYRKICVFDFETDSPKPESCNLTQIAALVLDARKLTPIKGGEFYLKVKPEGLDKIDSYMTTERKSTIAWHCKTRGIDQEELLTEWNESCDQKYGWQQFSEFINMFNPKKTAFTAPIPAGMNIRNFDLPIAKRMNEKYKIKTMFWYRDSIDILDMCFMWFENVDNGPKNFKMDTLREFFGLANDEAHDALFDVKQETEVITKFLKLCRRYSNRVTFAGSCS